MHRQLEPELMQDEDQVKAYAEADLIILLNAFTIEEIKQQLQLAELSLAVEQTTDRHVFIFGKL